MTFVGMVVEEVQQLATQMDQNASEIRELASRLTSVLETTHWVGTDHDSFHSDWNGSHVPALNAVCQGLNDAAVRARQNAQQQTDASAT